MKSTKDQPVVPDDVRIKVAVLEASVLHSNDTLNRLEKKVNIFENNVMLKFDRMETHLYKMERQLFLIPIVCFGFIAASCFLVCKAFNWI